jgi:hypothetical protein
MAELMTIGEVAHRAHIAPSAIRYYERRGLLSADGGSRGSAATGSKRSAAWSSSA